MDAPFNEGKRARSDDRAEMMSNIGRCSAGTCFPMLKLVRRRFLHQPARRKHRPVSAGSQLGGSGRGLQSRRSFSAESVASSQHELSNRLTDNGARTPAGDIVSTPPLIRLAAGTASRSTGRRPSQCEVVYVNARTDRSMTLGSQVSEFGTWIAVERASVKKFWKLNALGNNFVFTLHDDQVDHVQLARRVCAVATCVGSDGLLTIDLKSSPPTIRMWNPDGTTDFCANGLCCAAQLLHFLGHDGLDALNTPIRRVPIEVRPVSRSASIVTICMERGTFDPRLVPLALAHAIPAELGYDIRVAEEVIRVYPVNNGNMHSVILTDQLPSDEVFSRIGPLIENHPLFPYRTNVLWCVLDRNEVRMRVWERGVGETLSCGTGSAAVFSICERLGLLADRALSIATTGGISEVRAADDILLFTTRAQIAFEGTMIEEVP